MAVRGRRRARLLMKVSKLNEFDAAERLRTPAARAGYLNIGSRKTKGESV